MCVLRVRVCVLAICVRVRACAHVCGRLGLPLGQDREGIVFRLLLCGLCFIVEVGPLAASELFCCSRAESYCHSERRPVGALAHPVGATNTADGCEGVVWASCPVTAPDRVCPRVDCTDVCLPAHQARGTAPGESQSFEGSDSMPALEGSDS